MGLKFKFGSDAGTLAKIEGIPGLKVYAAEGFARGSVDAIAAARMATGLKWQGSNTPSTFKPGAIKWPKQVREYQREGVKFLCHTVSDHGAAILADDMGLGKGVCYNTPMLTPTGWTEAHAIRKGDTLIGADGSRIRVTGVFPQPKQKVYRVTFTDGCSVVVDGPHLWAVQTTNWRKRTPNKWAVKSTKELMGDLKRDLKSGPQVKWFIPMMTSPAQLEPAHLPLDPYFLGVLLGDGSLTRSPSLHLSEDKIGILKHLKFPGTDSANIRTDGFTIGICGGETARRLRTLNLMGTMSDTKFVPPAYLTSAPSHRLALLQGLMDTDGWCSNGSTQFCSASETLRDAVVELTQSLGGVARKSVKPEPKFKYKGEIKIGLPSYQATLSLPLGINPFRARAHKHVAKTKYPPSRGIVSIEPCGKRETVCFSVDAPDKLYVIKDYIVTHNTLQTLTATRAIKQGRVLILCPAAALETWRDELTKWGFTPSVVLTSSASKSAKRQWDEAPKAEYVVTSYDHRMVERCIEKAFPHDSPDVLILDEAHRLRGRDSRRSKMLETVRPLCRAVIAMTATPQFNRPKDLYQLLRILYGHRFGGKWDFDMRYCGARPGKFGGLEYPKKGSFNADELKLRLTYYLLRREKHEVAHELPPMTIQVRWVDATKEARSVFLQSQMGIGKKSLHDALMATLKGKMEEAIALAVETRRFILATWTREHARQFYNLLNQEHETPCVLIGGDMPVEKRAESIRDAKAKGWGIVATTDSISESLNLQGVASVGILHALDYVPLKLHQLFSRLHRLGQQDPVHWYLLAMRETVDQIIIATQVNKLQQFQDIMGSKGIRNMKHVLADEAAIQRAEKEALQEIYAAMK
jgi:superfamily II DNA or RNA helicase